MAAPFIAGFDIATATGVCDGPVGGKPRVFTWHLDDAGTARPVKLAYFRRLCDQYFTEVKLDAVYFEKALNIRIALKIGASDEQVSLLRGLIGVFESCAANAGIPIIEGIDVQDARQSLTGQRTFDKVAGKSTAKDAVMRVAATMGVSVDDEHQADAYAIWWRAGALHNPRLAHLSTPLFRSRR